MKLNVGSGSALLETYTNLDIKRGGSAYPLQLDGGVVVQPNTCTEIRASHVLEHLSFGKVELALNNWYSCLKPGGVVKIAVPDLAWLAQEILKPIPDPLTPRYLCGGQTDADDYHKSAWSGLTLTNLLQRIGFVVEETWEDTPALDTAMHKCSLRIMARKPRKDAVPPATTPAPATPAVAVKIQACITVPRFGSTDAFFTAQSALAPFQIPIARIGGAYWHHGIQRLIADALDQGLDWVLTLDYDTLFTADHVSTLLRQFAKHPKLDALAAIQPQRGSGRPLVSLPNVPAGGTATIPLGVPFKVKTAHFGFTLFRLSAFKGLPFPWFYDSCQGHYLRRGIYTRKGKGGKANLGKWGHKTHIHPDIQFWLDWYRQGRTVGMTTAVSVGHLEVVAASFVSDPQTGALSHQWQTPEDWRAVQEGKAPAYVSRPEDLTSVQVHSNSK